MSNNILNETFQRHLALLKKKLNEADQQGELPLRLCFRISLNLKITVG